MPSTARTVSADEAETETDTNVESEDGSGPPERVRSDPGVYPDEQIVQHLDPSQSLAERIAVVERISKDAKLYQFSAIVTVLKKVEDLAMPAAPADARRALFALAQASAAHPGLSEDGRSYLFNVVTYPADASMLEYQTKSIRYITEKGLKLGLFSHSLIDYVKNHIERQYNALSEARRRYKNLQEHQPQRKKVQLPEERGLYSLCSLIVDLIENSSSTIVQDDQLFILDQIIAIAETTGSKSDLKRAVTVLAVFIRSSEIPESRLDTVVDILCATSSAVSDLSKDIQGSLLLLLQSKHQATIVKHLLHTLALSPQDRHTHTVCGALSVLRYLVENKAGRNLPTVSFAQFIESLWKVHFASRKIRRDCLQTISSLLVHPRLAPEILHSNWQHMIETILTATGDDLYTPDQSNSRPLAIRQPSSPDNASSASESRENKTAADEIYELLKQIASSLNVLWRQLNHGQRVLVGRFYYELRAILPTESFDSLITAMAESGSLRPLSEGWQETQRLFCDSHIVGRHLDPDTYCYAVFQLKQNVLKEPTSKDSAHYWSIASTLLEDFPRHQKGWRAAGALAALVVEIWQYSAPPDAAKMLVLLEGLITTGPDIVPEKKLETGAKSMAQFNLGGVTVSLVELFLNSLTPGKQSISAAIYMMLVNTIANSRDLVADVRLPALKLLTRLRCNESGAIFVTKDADTLGLAASLSRTEGSMPASVNRIDRASVATETSDFRRSRSGAHGGSLQGQMRKSVPVSSHKQSTVVKPPLWMYPGGPGLPRDPPPHPSRVVSKESASPDIDGASLKLSEWLLVVIQILQDESDWEVYSYVVVHLPTQLCNLTLFSDSMPVLKHLRKVIVGQLRDRAVREPPAGTGVKKGDVALCLMNALVVLLGYCELFEDRGELDDAVRTFVTSIGEWERATKTCIQALAISCHILPTAVSKRLPELLHKLSQMITQSHLTKDILEFLAGLARLPSLYTTFREEDYRMVFAICVKYLENSREQRLKFNSRPGTGKEPQSHRTSGISSRQGPISDHSHTSDCLKDVHQYIFALAYHVLSVWFLAVPLQDRHKHVGWITKNLAWVDDEGVERMEEQSQVTLDMMLRATYSNLNETNPSPEFGRREVRKRSWLIGLSIVTMETDMMTGLTQITKRQASGTTHTVLQLNTAPLPAHHAPSPEQSFNVLRGYDPPPNVFPNHVFLQMGATAAPTPIPMEPIHLPDDAFVGRAFTSFDRNKTVDGYKVAVIYVGNGQDKEREILANTDYTTAFGNLLVGIGTRVDLKGAIFNTQGLDTEHDVDGTYTYAWRDRLVEIVYHVPTLMPTNEDDDPQCVNKKKHVGNDFVSIIFNDSGLSWNFDTIPSQVNLVNIVITPENKVVPHDVKPSKEEVAAESAEVRKSIEDIAQNYTVQLQTHASLPSISPAATMKLVPSSALPGLVRQLALSSSIFCNVWVHRDDGEYPSSWRNRLQEISRLRERYASTGTSTSVKYPGAKSTRTYSNGDPFAGRVQMGGIAEEEGVSVGLDFSRWAGAPPG